MNKKVATKQRRQVDWEQYEPLLPTTSTGLSSPVGPTTRSAGATSPNEYQQANKQASKKDQQQQQPRMPKRTTKTSQKLTLFPDDVEGEKQDQSLETDAVDASSQAQLPHAAKNQQWLFKLERRWLPRVTAYCTANEYKMDELMAYLKRKTLQNQTNPKRLDEVVYTPFSFTLAEDMTIQSDFAHFSNASQGSVVDSRRLFQANLDDVESFFDQNIDSRGQSIPTTIAYDRLAKQIAPVGEILFFDYGVVVMWGLSEAEELAMLDDLERFEIDRLEPDATETEQFYFHYNPHFQPRIYNDVITLKNPANFMLKVTISHAIAQSVKLTLFEGLIEETIDSTKHVPQIMAEEGKIHMSRKAINQKIGQLFIMRINVNLVSNVLDTPEIFWSEPALEPLYRAIRGYLEISQRVDLLNQRVSVISDLLDMLKEHLNSSHGEQLEWIVIILIAFEIIIGIVTISVDLSGYFHQIEK